MPDYDTEISHIEPTEVENSFEGDVVFAHAQSLYMKSLGDAVQPVQRWKDVPDVMHFMSARTMICFQDMVKSKKEHCSFSNDYDNEINEFSRGVCNILMSQQIHDTSDKLFRNILASKSITTTDFWLDFHR